jgi:predicted nuclease with TOPRIM domain
METKKCQECGNEYESKNTSGHEQKYCSSSCRGKAANKRRENNILEKFKGTIQPQTIIRNEERENERGIIENNSTNYGKSFGLSAERIFELVSTNANLSAENKRLEEKIKISENDYQKLEMEFDELESKLEENEKSGSMISGVNNFVDKVSPFIPIIYGLFSKNENNAKAKTA